MKLTPGLSKIMIINLNVKHTTTFSGQKLYWLGLLFVLLAFFLLAKNVFFGKRPRYTPKQTGQPVAIPDIRDKNATQTLFTKLNFQQAQEMYQKSYLKLINKIYQTDTTSIDVKKFKGFFYEYGRVQKKYKKVLGKIEDHENSIKLKCFAKMRTLIFAVLYHDRRSKKRMKKFDAKKLIKMGALKKNA